MRRAHVQKVVAAAAVLVLGTGVGIFAANPASSATAHCGDSRVIWNGTYDLRVPTISKSNPSSSCLLSYGDRGEGVRTLQWVMNKCYDAGLTIDESFGSRTRDALIKVQKDRGVKADGIYGADTRAAMNWALYLNGQFRKCGKW